MKPVFTAFLVVGAALPAVPSEAQDMADPVAESTAASMATAICTDRPTKANVVCTVPRSDIQIEADAINWTRFSSGGVDTDTILYTNPTIKYGLGATTDLELNISPYETAHVHGQGTSDTLGGVGDLYLRLKQQLTQPAPRRRSGSSPTSRRRPHGSGSATSVGKAASSCP